jgi:sulfoacetaldehyde dehydrogenase
MWIENKNGYRSLNPAIIARSAEVIAEGAGIKLPGGKRMIVVEGNMPPGRRPLRR